MGNAVDIAKIKEAVRMIIEAIGDDANRDGLVDTPERVANMYDELFRQNNNDGNKMFTVENLNDELVTIKNISFCSICEHHLLPFYGNVDVIYMPENCNVLGLSKFARIIDNLSHRLQIQERLTSDIANSILGITKKKFRYVKTSASHLCMSIRGVKQHDTRTIVCTIKGDLKDDINLLNRARILL